MRWGLVLLFTGLFLAQSQPPSPTPSKESGKNKKDGTSNQKQVGADDSQAQRGSVVINQYYPQPENQGVADGQGRKDSESPTGKFIEILSTAFLAFSTFLLFAATCALCYVAWLQRQTMEAHKKSFDAIATHLESGLAETKKAAYAAKLSAEALMSGERAQVTAHVAKPMVIGTAHPVSVPIDLLNSGSTPAYSCIYKTWIELCPNPFEDFTPSAVTFEAPYPVTIYPNSPAPMTLHVRLNRAFSPDEVFEISSGRKMLCFRIRVEYRDAFKEDRWAEFGYQTQGPTVGSLPKYNDAN